MYSLPGMITKSLLHWVSVSPVLAMTWDWELSENGLMTLGQTWYSMQQ